MKTTQYFQAMRSRPDRAMITDDWIKRAVERPIREVVQADGPHPPLGADSRNGNRHLRVVLLADSETVHNAFFDRDFVP